MSTGGNGLKRVPRRVVLPVIAGVAFVSLSWFAIRQGHITDTAGWSHSSQIGVAWGPEPTDIGPPADVLLRAFNLPALIALFPLFPLTYLIESEVLLRGAWGLVAVGQWFLIGCYFDRTRGLIRDLSWNVNVTAKKVLCNVTIIAGGLTLGVGAYSAIAGHSSVWAAAGDASFVFWGSVLFIYGLQWRSYLASLRPHIDSLHL
jgi:hypothetical protein